MDYSITFARHFSRLLWLLLHEGGNVDEQKAALRALVTVSRDGAVVVATQNYNLVVNGKALPDALTGVQDLAAQLIGHAVGEVRVQQNAAAADLLGFARILAGEPDRGAPGTAILERLAAIGARTLDITPRTMPLPAPPPIIEPRRSSGAVDNGADPAGGASTAATPDPVRKRSKRASGSTGVVAPADPGARATDPVLNGARDPRAPSPRSRLAGSEGATGPSRARAASAAPAPAVTGGGGVVQGIVHDEASGRYLAFAAVHAPKESTAATFAKLDASKSPAIATRILDELVALAENAGRDGNAPLVAEVMSNVVVREERARGEEKRRVFSMALRRMSKPSLLRYVAILLPRHRDRAEPYLAVLARAGEDGAEALIEQLTTAQSLSDRRVYFDGLVTLQAGIPALMHMLGDPRWYVVRNAADLLGELQAAESELPLTEAARHDDDRVRRAAATALAKLGTPRAHHALREAIRDTSAQVRMQAAIGLAQHKNARGAVTLVRALDAEDDEDVQVAILGSLGRLATPDAVQKLIAAAEPEGRIFKKKSPAFRLAAVQALADAKTPEAIAALKELVEDRDREVRQLVAGVLAERESSGSIAR
ncbi:MAG TPA: HEAT repeat domain-containing protein [Gemmatimonadaceae bacterium]|nr:HEAT repeat domain-containing protein [Gemmatimonadaceae bacterium]